MQTDSERLPWEATASTSSSQASIETIRATPYYFPASLTSPQGARFSRYSQPTQYTQQGSSSSSYASEAVSTPSSSADQQQQIPKKKIPRPPNAWILYRSAKVKIKEKDAESNYGSPLPWHDIDVPTPSSSTSASGDSSTKPINGQKAVQYQIAMSRKVADMWRAETDEVKKRYYELAKRKKEEHERMYPGYKYRPNMNKANGEKGESVKDEGVKRPAKKSRAAALIKGERPAPTAKTKGKGLLDLYIDVDAAEKETPFSLASESPISAILGRPSRNSATSSYYRLGNDALDEATTVVDRLVSQRAIKEECASATSGLMTGKSNAWVASPLPLTPAEGQSAKGEDTVTEPWTAWIMDNPSSAEPSTPTSNNDYSKLTAPLTEPPPIGKGKKAKRVGSAKADSRVRNTSRRKSTSSAGFKLQTITANGGTSSAASAGTASLQKKFKRAVINQEYVKASAALKCEAEKDRKGFNDQTPIEHNMNSNGNTLDLLLKSYDRDGVDSEVEEALLCADALIESFASMAAWSPDQGWFTGLPHTAPADITPSQDLCTLNPSSWTLYSQPSTEIQAGGMDLQAVDTQMMNLLHSQMQMPPLMPQILQPSSFVPAVEMDDVVMEASRRLADWDHLNPGQANNLDITANIMEEDWTLNEQEWDALLTQAIFDPTFGQAAAQQGTPATSSKALDTPPESVWDLIHFDSLSSQAPTPALPSKPIKEEGQVNEIVKEEAPVIELHGTYTEEQLREKLRQLTRTSAETV